MKHQHGFTLVELMVAVALFAILSTITFAAIQSALRSFEALTTKTHRQSELATALGILNDDFYNMSPRPIRNAPNVQREAFLARGPEETYFVEFTRAGLPIYKLPGEQLRSLGMASPQTGLARVAYQFTEEAIYRYEWNVLDADRSAATAETRRALILSGVDDVQVLTYSRDRDGALREQPSWPPVSARKQEALRQLPQAVSVLIRLQDLGELELFYAGV